MIHGADTTQEIVHRRIQPCSDWIREATWRWIFSNQISKG